MEAFEWSNWCQYMLFSSTVYWIKGLIRMPYTHSTFNDRHSKKQLEHMTQDTTICLFHFVFIIAHMYSTFFFFLVLYSLPCLRIAIAIYELVELRPSTKCGCITKGMWKSHLDVYILICDFIPNFFFLFFMSLGSKVRFTDIGSWKFFSSLWNIRTI